MDKHESPFTFGVWLTTLFYSRLIFGSKKTAVPQHAKSLFSPIRTLSRPSTRAIFIPSGDNIKLGIFCDVYAIDEWINM